MIYILKAMTNSFQTLISKVYFCKVFTAHASFEFLPATMYFFTLARRKLVSAESSVSEEKKNRSVCESHTGIVWELFACGDVFLDV